MDAERDTSASAPSSSSIASSDSEERFLSWRSQSAIRTWQAHKHEWHENFWFFSHFAALGFVLSGISATITGLFLAYLHVESYLLATYVSILTLPRSAAFLLGSLSDSRPIGGLRRKPYITLGWLLTCAACGFLSFYELPEPFHCVGADGRYDITAPPCNVSAPMSGSPFIAGIAVVILGVVMADSAAGALLLELSRYDSDEHRGMLIASTAMASSIGSGCGLVLTGLFFNGPLYNGTFQWSLSFNHICMVLGVVSAIQCAGVWLRGVHEHRLNELERKDVPRLRQFIKGGFQLLERADVFLIVLYQLGTSVLTAMNTTAAQGVIFIWAGQRQLQQTTFSLIGSFFMAFCISLVGKYLLHYSWRKLALICIVSPTLINALPIMLTVYDVLRNQYFVLGEELLQDIPLSISRVLTTVIIAEMAEEGTEGLFQGLVGTVGTIARPMAVGISNQIFRRFKPSLSNHQNFIDDTAVFRNTVAMSFLLQFACKWVGGTLVLLLPTQRDDLQKRISEWTRRRSFAYITVIAVFTALLLGLAVISLALNPATACLKIAGGDGCDSYDTK